jgi:hypothetical protein
MNLKIPIKRSNGPSRLEEIKALYPEAFSDTVETPSFANIHGQASQSLSGYATS